MAPLEDETTEGEEISIEDDEDVEPLKMARDPKLPSPELVEAHNRIHLPYRSWCKWCFMGRGRGLPHMLTQGSAIPRVGIDYFFITGEGVKKRKELEFDETDEGEAELQRARSKNEIIKCILIRCMETKCLFAHCIPCKGTDEQDYVANLVVEDILWLGHLRLIIKADNERSLQALIQRVMSIIRVKVCEDPDVKQLSKEEPATYDSQSNGGTEVGVMLIRGLFRTLKLCLESQIEKYIPTAHSVIPWLLEHTALLLNVRSRGSDGLTPWARVRGRAFGQQIIGFGEVVLYKTPTKGPRSQPDGNMGTKWLEGIFMGYNRSSNTYRVIGKEGLDSPRSLMRRPEPDRWSADKLAEIKATPWSERQIPDLTVRFDEAATKVDPTATAAPTAPREFRINQSDLDQHGYTDGCPQCAHIQRYGRTRPGGRHTERCRGRVREAVGATDIGKKRLEDHEERVNRAIAERIEKAELKTAAETRTHDKGGQTRSTLGSDTRPPNPDPRTTTTEATKRSEAEHLADLMRMPTGTETADEPEAKTTADEATDGIPEDGSDLKADVNDQYDTDMYDENDQGKDVDMGMGFIGSLEPSPDDFIGQLLLQQLGSSGRSFRREQRSCARRIVSEMYSPPRVTVEIRRGRYRHLMPGFALDLTVVDPEDGLPWDFSKPDKRDKARRMRRNQRPYMLIGSPECTAFSTWQRLNEARSKDRVAYQRARTAAALHIKFMMELYDEQIADGHYFLHEHPRYATSWQLAEVERLLMHPDVAMSHADQCQYGAKAVRGGARGRPIMKPTSFMSNSPEVLKALSKRCHGHAGRCSIPGGPMHASCSSVRAKDAAKYPRELCRAMLKGVTAQLRADSILKNGCYGLQAPDDDDEVAREIAGPAQGYSGRFKDDLTGQVLKDSLVLEARAKELAYFHGKGVWRKVPKSYARSRTGRPPISVRWVDVNKGDEQNPNYRSRLVARQLKAHDRSGETYFAPAPPLEALRTVLSMAMTSMGEHKPLWDPLSPQRTQLSFIDVKRAYFNARIDPNDAPTFVALPAEDADHLDMCAQLLCHMYGTRGAADGWQEEYSTMLIELGFEQGISCPNVFRHAQRGICLSVHGDDFTAEGPKPALDWYEEAVAQRYEITVGPRLGPGPGDAKEGRSLNRVIRWTDEGLQYEADPRQAERLMAECGLEGEGVNPMVTPGVRPTFHELEEDKPLPQQLYTAFRGAAARGNYLAADRIDAQFACKEVCRWMSSPSEHSWKALKRICRFLRGVPRLVYTYPRQVAEGIDVYTDTDWAGCPKTRKSTSGGCIMIGRHAIKHWSSTQASVALSSGEAEFAGVVRGSGQGLGYQALLRDFGVEARLRVWTDSSAAIGICSRQGLGKLRHLDTHTLWIQQAVRLGKVDLRKIAGEVNPADLLTKHSLSRMRLEKLVELHGCRYLGGRAKSAPQTRRAAPGRVTMAAADIELNSVQPLAGDITSQEETGGAGGAAEASPVMPHIQLSDQELDREYPPMVAPNEDRMEDLAEDLEDPVFETGKHIAESIRQEMRTRGRTRREAARVAASDAIH